MKPWQRKEKKDAKDFGANQTARSGGGWTNKGDMKNDIFSIDSKLTTKLSFTISHKLWEKITLDAYKHKPIRIPMLSIQLGTGEELIVLTKADFLSLQKE